MHLFVTVTVSLHVSQQCEMLCQKPAPTSACFKNRAAVVGKLGLTWESCRVQGKREKARDEMEFKGTRRRWLTERGIESRCMGLMDTAEREEGQSRDKHRGQEGETTRKRRL